MVILLGWKNPDLDSLPFTERRRTQSCFGLPKRLFLKKLTADLLGSPKLPYLLGEKIDLGFLVLRLLLVEPSVASRLLQLVLTRGLVFQVITLAFFVRRTKACSPSGFSTMLIEAAS